MHVLDGPASPSTPTRSAVIVPIANADPVVARHRRRLDHSAGWGVPAHITVLFPFVRPGDVDASVITTLEAAVASVTAFDCAFTHTGWFGSDVLWLAPHPEKPFKRLTDAVWTAFPDHPPYGGAFTTPQPHLTVAEASLARAGSLEAVEAAVLAQLPFRHHVDHVLLIAGSEKPDSWRTLHRITLSPAESEARSRH